MEKSAPVQDYVLGLDIGTNSVGWAAVEQKDGKPVKLLRAGVRVFDAGVEGDIESGRDESRAVKRRQARLRRRMLARRARRLVKLARLLQGAGLLPAGDLSTAEARNDFFVKLDNAIFSASARKAHPHTLPYLLRAQALDKKLSPHELGRAIYHLAQRRGFWSNRKVQPKNDKEETGLKAKISGLAKRIADSGARTLGEYFSKLDPAEERIRTQHTGRQMFKDEFEMIWTKQVEHYPQALTEEFKKKVKRAIFFQRPIKWDRDTIADCELEPGCKCAPLAILPAQKFRMLDKLNNLRVVDTTTGEERALDGEERQKLLAVLDVEGDLKFTYHRKPKNDKPSVRDVLGWQPKEYIINLEKEEGEDYLVGNRTAAKLVEVFGKERWNNPVADSKMVETAGKIFVGKEAAKRSGESWKQLSDTEKQDRKSAVVREWDALLPDKKNGFIRDCIVEDVRSIQAEAAQTGRGKDWGLDGAKAREFGKLAFADEGNHLSYSRQALAKLLPWLEQGVPLSSKDPPGALQRTYPKRMTLAPMEKLPPIQRAPVSKDNDATILVKRDKKHRPYYVPIPEVRNPTVERALNEVRKVVNAILRVHGKPAIVRIEMAREEKKNRKERKAIWGNNQMNRKRREAARKVLGDAGVDPSDYNITKYLLWEECGHGCPYTGKTINFNGLFGAHPQFDIEHIIPFSRCLDDSFLNKTLCDVEENRRVKQNRTPWEAYGSDPKRWNDILERVKRFTFGQRFTTSKKKEEPFKVDDTVKLEIFQIQDEDLQKRLENFAARQLTDTAYASRHAVRYLGLLYGAGADGNDPAGKKRVQAGRGRLTSYLRNIWDLNAILKGGGTKSRDDHRHHAVDSVCIALTDPGTVDMLRKLSEMGWYKGRAGWLDRKKAKPPWPTFYGDVQATVDKIVVSHRVSRKVSGALHDETIYSKEQKDNEGRKCVHVRKRLDERFTAKLVEDIVDPVVRECVRAHLKQHGDDPKKAFADEANHPKMKSGMPVHKVRIRKYESTMPIASGARGRRVMSGSNHHVEIFECLDKKGKPYWDGEVVSTFEALRRLRAGESVVKRNHEEGGKFRFSLGCGDLIEMDGKDGSRSFFVVRSVDNKKDGLYVKHVGINDARKQTIKDEDKKIDIRVSASLKQLMEKHCQRIIITPLGEVRRAND